MAANTNPIHPGVPVNPPATIVNADSTNKKTIMTAGENGTRLDSLHICSDDTSSANLNFYLTVGGMDHFIGQVAVPAGSGAGSTPWQEGLATLNGNAAMVLAAGTTLKVSAAVAVTAAKTVTVIAFGGDF
jgi:acyl-CoA reductase-like NAD-dependent aldehyde dehydrogenase